MKKIDIIYEDKNLLVVNKQAKMLTISDGKTDDTLYSMAKSYVKKKHKSNKIFIVHRLDKDTSGVVIFAKNEQIKKYLQDNWNDITNRSYLALIEGKLKNKKGIIKEYLKETKTHMVYVTKDKSGEYAETHYEVIKYVGNNTLVKINIKTGKKHQIRVAFSNLGYPILGDKKYGSRSNNYKRVCLHANSIELNINNETKVFEAKLPLEFKKIM